MSSPETLTPPKPPPLDRLPPEIREMSARFRFDLEEGRSFLITLDRGRIALEEGAAGAECRFRCSMEVFQRALSGEGNLLTALMRGNIRVYGDLELAKRLYRYLRLARTEGRPS